MAGFLKLNLNIRLNRFRHETFRARTEDDMYGSFSLQSYG